MRSIWVRLLLAVFICAALCVSPAPRRAEAGGGGRWTSFPMLIDGVASAAEWGDAVVQAFGAGIPFEVRFRNDADFFYLLIDATGDTGNDPIGSAGDYFQFSIDVDQNGAPTAGVDRLYGYSNTYGTALATSISLGGTAWSAAALSRSFVKEGFGSTPGMAASHRFYELAVRLSELKEPPHNSLSAGFYLHSQTPAITVSYPGFADLYAMSNYSLLGLYPQLALYIYNSASPSGYSDYLEFRAKIFSASGISLESADLGLLEQVDLSPYTAVIIGPDAGDETSSIWLGSVAAAEKLRASGKPVIGIGLGGLGLFTQLGMELRYSRTWKMTPAFPGWAAATTNIYPAYLSNPAWSVPLSISAPAPTALNNNKVAYYAFYYSSTNRSLYRLGVDPLDPDGNHYTLIAERSPATNLACYTLWGVNGSPSTLTTTGARLLSNLIVTPPCMRAVMYIYKADTTLRDQVNSDLAVSGFYTGSVSVAALSPAALQPYDILIVDPGTTDSDWNTTNAGIVRDSQKPVLGICGGGARLFQNLGLSINWGSSGILTNQTGLVISDAFLPVMLHPYPVRVFADQSLPVYSSGVNISGVILPTVPFQVMRMGRLPGGVGYWSAVSQSAGGVCYMLWGGSTATSGMTTEGKALFKNMLVDQPCRYAGFLPTVRR